MPLELAWIKSVQKCHRRTSVRQTTGIRTDPPKKEEYCYVGLFLVAATEKRKEGSVKFREIKGHEKARGATDEPKKIQGKPRTLSRELKPLDR